MAHIAALVEDEYGLSRGETRVRTNRPEVCEPRQVAMWLMRTSGKASLSQIGRFFALHHTSVLHGVRKISDRIGDEELTQIKNHVEEVWISTRPQKKVL